MPTFSRSFVLVFSNIKGSHSGQANVYMIVGRVSLNCSNIYMQFPHSPYKISLHPQNHHTLIFSTQKHMLKEYIALILDSFESYPYKLNLTKYY